MRLRQAVDSFLGKDQGWNAELKNMGLVIFIPSFRFLHIAGMMQIFR